MSDLSAWTLSIGAFAAIVVCMAVAARSIAGDPPRGRRRCPRCWHDLGPGDDGESLRPCGECGHLARSERELGRTRRSIARAILAIAAIVAIAMATRFRMIDRGIWSMAPTSLLLAVSPYSDGGGFRTAPWELAHRVRSGAASDAQVRAGLDLFATGDPGHAPGSPAWRSKYRDLGSAVIGRLGARDPALTRLLAIPPAFEVAVLSGAPLASGSAPPVLVLDADVWWPEGYEGRLVATLPDGSTRTAEFRPEGRFPPLLLEMPATLPGANESVELRLAARPIGMPLPEQGWREYPAVSTALPAHRGESARRWIPRDSEEMRREIAKVFDQGLVLWAEGASRGGMRFDSTVTAGELFEDVAIGLVVEVCEDGVPRRTSRMWWPGGASRRGPRWLSSVEDADAMDRLYRASAEETAARWKLRIRGDERLAHYGALTRELLAGGASPGGASKPEERALGSWFAGGVEVPLVVERQPSPAPVRRWRIPSP